MTDDKAEKKAVYDRNHHLAEVTLQLAEKYNSEVSIVMSEKDGGEVLAEAEAAPGDTVDEVVERMEEAYEED